MFLTHIPDTELFCGCLTFLTHSSPVGCLSLQVSFAFNRVESALSYILAHLSELSGIAAEAERLDALLTGQQ